MTVDTPAIRIRSSWNQTRSIIGLLMLSLFVINGCQGSSSQPEEASVDAVDAEARLMELGITLPQPPSPVANYVNAVRTGNLIFLAGKGPRSADGEEIIGKLGAGISIEEGYRAARLTASPRFSVLLTITTSSPLAAASTAAA